jgi:ketosteroid isomerase-like protein
MSQENVEVVRRAFETFNARDVDRLVSLWEPDCEFLPFRAQLEGITYRGHLGIRRFVRDMDEDWSEFRIDPLEVHQRDERVVVIGRVSALGRGTSVKVDYVAGFVAELRRGLITRLTSHSDPEAALRATERKRTDSAAGSDE